MKTSARFLALALLGTSSLLGDAPTFTHEFKPAIIDARDADRRTLGARFEFGVKRDFDATAFAAYGFATTKGTLTLESEANPENLVAEIGGGTAWRIGGTVPLSLEPPLDPTQPSPPPATPIRDALINLDLKVGFETDQPFDNTQLAIGPRAGYTHTQNAGLWPLLPSLAVAYQRIHVLDSAFLTQHGIPERDFWRLDLSAAWKWRPFARADANAILSRIGLHADVRYFQAFELPAEAQALNQEEAFYTAGTLSYETQTWPWLRQVYLTVAHGRLPPSPREDTTIFLGVVLGK